MGTPICYGRLRCGSMTTACSHLTRPRIRRPQSESRACWRVSCAPQYSSRQLESNAVATGGCIAARFNVNRGVAPLRNLEPAKSSTQMLLIPSGIDYDSGTWHTVACCRGKAMLSWQVRTQTRLGNVRIVRLSIPITHRPWHSRNERHIEGLKRAIPSPFG